MARRSPLNERYQKNTAPAGKTRRSAASAKPKREAGVSREEIRKTEAKKTPFVMNPPTEEYRSMRRIWWVLILGSAVVVLISAAIRAWTNLPESLSNALVMLGYAGIIGAVYIDWMKLRKMRTEYTELARQGKAPAPAEKTSKSSAEGEAGAEDE